MRTRTRRRMPALVRQWERSGETRCAFAKRRAVTLSLLRLLSPASAGARQSNPVEFVPVRVVADAVAPGTGLIEVVVASGERVVIREGACGHFVRHVVSALRASR